MFLLCLFLSKQDPLSLMRKEAAMPCLKYYLISTNNTETVCTFETFATQYGLSEDENGVKRLKGPGVYEAPGAAHMGGRLPFRLLDMCDTYRQLEETEMYDQWIKGGLGSLQNFLCFNPKEDDLDLNFCGRKQRRKPGYQENNPQKNQLSDSKTEL